MYLPMEYENLSAEKAAAELYARSLAAMRTIDTAWRKDGTNVVCATTNGKGVHLFNQCNDFNADVHLVCETEQIDAAGNLPDDTERDDHGDVYFNVEVHGLADDPVGAGLPTHVSGPQGASIKDDIDSELRRIAEAAGLALPEE